MGVAAGVAVGVEVGIPGVAVGVAVAVGAALATAGQIMPASATITSGPEREWRIVTFDTLQPRYAKPEPGGSPYVGALGRKLYEKMTSIPG